MSNADYGLAYAEVYDLITSHKDYSEETKKLLGFLSNNGAPKNILSIGCGTGSHETIISKFDYNVVGFDTSPYMIKKAQEKESNNLRFTMNIDDSREYFKGNSIGCVISLFNVINCLPDTKALLSFFKGALVNLNTDGFFIFEAWNRDEIFLHPPVVVNRKFDFAEGHLERLATPYLCAKTSSLRIGYKIKGQLNSKEKSIKSVHNLKLFGIREIVTCLRLVGFSRVKIFSAFPEFEEQKVVDNMVHGKRMLAFVARR